MTAVRHDSGPDAGAVWHYGDPLREQRLLAAGRASVDLSHRPVFSVTGPDRLSWLHAISSQKLDDLAPGVWTTAYILDAQGRITHVFAGADDGRTFRAATEPGHLEALLEWLTRMRFAARVELADDSADWAMVIGRPSLPEPAAFPEPTSFPELVEGSSASSFPELVEGSPVARPAIVPRSRLEAVLGEVRAGTWAAEALRIAAGVPRIFLDTDERTIPNELANPDGPALGAGVHLKKGCYPGQETVARVYTLGRPPRRVTLLHLDGSAEALPAVGADLLAEGRVVGRVGTSERHHELGPIALGLLKRAVPLDAPLLVDGIAAAQELLVDPEVGLHIRPRLG